MRDVMLYEDSLGRLFSEPGFTSKTVPVVVGITVAEVEAMDRAIEKMRIECNESVREAKRERDEARTSLKRAGTIESRALAAEAARCREALERLTEAAHAYWGLTTLDDGDPVELHAVDAELEAAVVGARDVLGGGDDE